MFYCKKEQSNMRQQLITDFMKLNMSLILKALEGLAFQQNNTLMIQPILKTETLLNSNIKK